MALRPVKGAERAEARAGVVFRARERFVEGSGYRRLSIDGIPLGQVKASEGKVVREGGGKAKAQ